MNVEQFLFFRALSKIKELSDACDKSADELINQFVEFIANNVDEEILTAFACLFACIVILGIKWLLIILFLHIDEVKYDKKMEQKYWYKKYIK